MAQLIVKLTFDDNYGPEYYWISEDYGPEDAIVERAKALYMERDMERDAKFVPIPRTIVSGEVL